MSQSQYLPGDPRLVDQLDYELKSKGIFDKFRKECIADVDTKPAYQNLRQRVESSVSVFLSRQAWKPDLNKNQLREKLRKYILDGNYLEQGVERIVDQVVNPKVASVFIPQVEDIVYNYLGIARKKPEIANGSVENDLLPTDLEAVSPGSVHDDKEMVTEDIAEEKMETDEVTDEKVTVEVEGVTVEKEDSQISGIIDLTSRDSEMSIDKSTIPLPKEDIKPENIPRPDDSPPKVGIAMNEIDLPKDPYPSTEIPLPDEIPPQVKDNFFKPLPLSSEDESSSDSSLMRNMSPLTPVRNFDDDSCDAQQAFESNDDKNGVAVNTFKFTIEGKNEFEDKKSEVLSYNFENKVNIFNPPAYEDSSNSNNLQIDYESDANSNSKASKTTSEKQEPDQNSEDSKKSDKKTQQSKDKKDRERHSSKDRRDRTDKKKDDRHKSKSSSTDIKKDSKSRHSSHKSSSQKDPKKSDKGSSLKTSSRDEKKSKSSDRSKEHRSSSKSSHREKDKERKSSSKSKDEKKKKKDVDDHYSSSGRNNSSRRSTDRDSNDGNSSSSKSSNHRGSTKSETKKSTSSKSETTSSSGTSPSDKEIIITEAKEIKPVIVDAQLNTPIMSSPLNFSPGVLKKPKFASNFEEAKKLMKMRKAIDEEQRRMNQEAALLLEFHANIRPGLSQVYSSIPGPELEFTCMEDKQPETNEMIEDFLNNTTNESVRQELSVCEITVNAEKSVEDILGEIDAPKCEIEEKIDKPKTEIEEIDVSIVKTEIKDVNVNEEENLYYFTSDEMNSVSVKAKKLRKIIKNIELPAKLHLVNCDNYVLDVFNDICKETGIKVECYHKNGHARKIVKDIEVTNKELFISSNVNGMFSPSKNDSFELSLEYNSRIQDMANTTSRQEIMEIILGGIAEDVTSPSIHIFNEKTDNFAVKRRHSEIESTNNNTCVLTPNKIRKISGSDQISSTTVEPEVTNHKITKSKYLGKARRVGLPKPKRMPLPNSPSSDKSVENYEVNIAATTVNGKIKQIRNTVQRYDTSDLYKPKLHFLSKRNTTTP